MTPTDASVGDLVHSAHLNRSTPTEMAMMRRPPMPDQSNPLRRMCCSVPASSVLENVDPLCVRPDMVDDQRLSVSNAEAHGAVDVLVRSVVATS